MPTAFEPDSSLQLPRNASL